MAEYIDRSNLPKIPKGLNEKGVQGFKMCLKLLKEQPTADVVPRSEVESLKSTIGRLQGILLQFTDVVHKWGAKNNIDTTEISLVPIMNTEADNIINIINQAKQDVARAIFEQAFEYKDLADWYISSVDDRDTPVWTDEHIEELLNDFYVIPKDEEYV